MHIKYRQKYVHKHSSQNGVTKKCSI